MTNEEKKAILLKAIEIVKKFDDNRDSHGICYAIRNLTGFYEEESSKVFGLEYPLAKYAGLFGVKYSFPLTKEGDAQRIALLEEAIKKLEN